MRLNNFARLFIFTLIFSFGLSTVAEAFFSRLFGTDPASEIVGVWKLESYANGPKPIEEIELFKDGTALAKDERWQQQQGLSPGMGISGTWKIENNRLVAMFGPQGMTIDYTLSGATLTFMYDKNTN